MKPRSNFKSEYAKIYALVEKGHTIESACKELGHSRSYFYNNASEQQKIELRSISAINSKCPRGAYNYYADIDTRTFEEDDEI